MSQDFWTVRWPPPGSTSPPGVIVDNRDGRIYVADHLNSRIRVIFDNMGDCGTGPNPAVKATYR